MATSKRLSTLLSFSPIKSLFTLFYSGIFSFFFKTILFFFIIPFFPFLSLHFIIRTKFEIEIMLVVVIFLYEQREFNLANKLHNIASILNSTFNSSNNLNDSFSSFVSFIQDSYSSSPSFPDPILNGNLSSIVSNLLSLSSHFIPPNQPKSLLSPQGIYVFYKSLTSICAPLPSPYTFYSLTTPSPSYSSSYSPSNSPSSPSSIPVNEILDSVHTPSSPSSSNSYSPYSSHSSHFSYSPSLAPVNDILDSVAEYLAAPSSPSSSPLF